MADRKWPLGNFFGKNLVWNSRRTAQNLARTAAKVLFVLRTDSGRGRTFCTQSIFN